VSVHANQDGRALVWRRIPESGALVREEDHFRPWLLLAHLDDLLHLRSQLVPEGDPSAVISHRELEGPGALRHLVSARDGRALTMTVLQGASARLKKRIGHFGDIEDDSVLSLPHDEQYLVATGRTYFRELPFDLLHRLQFDLETTGLESRRDRIFMISIRYHTGETEVLEARAKGNAGAVDL